MAGEIMDGGVRFAGIEGTLLTTVVYTCQKPQHKRCRFFLWDDEANKRAKIVVMNNTRSEPQTPSKPPPAQLPSPRSSQNRLRFTDLKAEPEDDFNWSSEDDEAFAKVTEANEPLPETPTKVAKLDYNSTPSKRKLEERVQFTPNPQDDVFTTAKDNGFASPTKVSETGKLTTDVLRILKPVNISAEIEEELVTLLDRDSIEMKGVIKGRDISREAIKAKDKRIAELSSRIVGLEGERETNKAVIAHLKEDMATYSPKARRKK
ncbi:MAG: hypothetical protein Q9160_002460 [Pyrenula sp. 1 TL-2023]